MSQSQVFAPAYIYGVSSGSPNGWVVITRDVNDDAWRPYIDGSMSEDVARTTAAALNDATVRKEGSS
jgi:hypothetical protein